ASQNRLLFFLQQFVSVFARQEHPLVVFLDDLQWVDMASLDLMQHLLPGVAGQSLLVIGAYRDNEVDRQHPLLHLIDAIENTGNTLQLLTLAPLTREHVHALITDTFRYSTEPARPFAELVYEKTAGNPFFVRALVTSLADEQLLSFTPGA